MFMTPSWFEKAIQRDQRIVLAGLLAVIVLSWAYLLAGAGMNMPQEAGAMTAMTPRWTPAYAGLMVIMWWVMMLAMMLPSAAPAILVFAALNRTQAPHGTPVIPSGVFAAGYGLAWGGFSLLATALQWRLSQGDLLTPAMASAGPALGGGLLIAAGLYQFSPWKQACLRHCRTPLDFLARHWRPGMWGALRMGAEHGLYCLGCCWVLMGLLFYGGVMSLAWISGLALFVMAEKVLPVGRHMGWIAGAALILWGLAVLWLA